MATGRRDPIEDLQERERTQDERTKPFSAILRDIIGNIQTIIRSEIRLVRTELKEEASLAFGAGALGLFGVVLAILGLGFLFAALTFGLALVMPAWLACLLVALALLMLAGALVLIAWSRFRKVRIVPARTVESLKENAEWLRNQAR